MEWQEVGKAKTKPQTPPQASTFGELFLVLLLKVPLQVAEEPLRDLGVVVVEEGRGAAEGTALVVVLVGGALIAAVLAHYVCLIRTTILIAYLQLLTEAAHHRAVLLDRRIALRPMV